MTTRRTIIKSIPALGIPAAVARAAQTSAAEAGQKTVPYEWDDRVEMLLLNGRPGGTTMEIGVHNDERKQVFRIWGMDRDWDGVWTITADSHEPTEHDMGGQYYRL